MRIFLLLLLFFTYQIANSQLVINEIVSDNKSLVFDYEGGTPDVIEFYNNSASPIQLSDYYLSDKQDEPDQWQFPDTLLNGNDFILVFASNKTGNGTELHANFKIASDGDKIFLHNTSGLVDSYPKVSLRENESFGRVTDGANEMEILAIPTLGFSNNQNVVLSISQPSGFYKDSLVLSISKNNPAAVIRYTTNGNTPDSSSLIWDGDKTFYSRTGEPNNYANIKTSAGFYIPTQEMYKIHVLRFAAFTNNQQTSTVYDRSFIVDKNTNHDRFSFPIFSVVTDSNSFFNYDTGIYVPGVHFVSSNKDWTGNYFQSGEAWERKIHLTMFDANQEVLIDQDAGARIHGGRKRYSKVKTLRFYARDKYGDDHFRTRLFGDDDKDEYKRFIIRNPHGCWNKTVIKDALTHYIVHDFNMEVQNMQPSVIFVNGEYWGLNTIRDYLNHHHLNELYGVDPDSLDILNTSSHFVDMGSDTGYVNLIDYMTNHDLTSSDHYEYVSSKMDISNFIDYQIAEIFFNNNDWPYGNTKYWRKQGEGGKWRWMFFDIDAGWGHKGPSYNMLDHATTLNGSSTKNPPESTFLLRTLLTNESFKNDFIGRFSCLLETRFQPDTLIEAVNTFQAWYEPGITEQATRWNVPSSLNAWNSSVNGILKNFVSSRRSYLITHISSFFDLPNYNPTDYCNINSTGEEYTSEIKTNVTAQPNPFNNHLMISVSGKNQVSHQLTDGLGRLLYSSEKAFWDLNTTELSPGIYYLKSVINNDIQIKKLVKQ